MQAVMQIQKDCIYNIFVLKDIQHVYSQFHRCGAFIIPVFALPPRIFMKCERWLLQKLRLVLRHNGAKLLTLGILQTDLVGLLSLGTDFLRISFCLVCFVGSKDLFQDLVLFSLGRRKHQLPDLHVGNQLPGRCST